MLYILSRSDVTKRVYSMQVVTTYYAYFLMPKYTQIVFLSNNIYNNRHIIDDGTLCIDTLYILVTCQSNDMGV